MPTKKSKTKERLLQSRVRRELSKLTREKDKECTKIQVRSWCADNTDVGNYLCVHMFAC